MKAWKQLLWALVIVAAPAALWTVFAPQGRQWLAWTGLNDTAAASGQPAGGQGRGGRAAAPQVGIVTADVRHAVINDSLQAICSGRANQSVAVTPFSAGQLKDIRVKSGSHVAAGEVVANLDSDVEEIALERAKAARDDARARLDRLRQLRQRSAATDVQVSDAELVLRDAELAARNAEVTYQRRSIVSPIAGIVGILPIEAGNYVTTQTTVATVDDRSSITIDFWVPERFATMIAVGNPLAATPISRPGESFDGVISAVDNRLDEASRTLRVQASVPNPDDTLRAGMSFQVTMKFPGNDYPAVDALAIQWSLDGAYVWAVRGGKAARVPVRIVQRNTENVLVDGQPAAGDKVVTEGVYAVREGQDVMLAGEPAAPLARTGS